MTRLITIEQAVEAVERVPWTTHGRHFDAIIAALRAQQPAEPTEEEVERVTDALLPRHDYGDRKEAEEDARAALAAMRGGR